MIYIYTQLQVKMGRKISKTGVDWDRLGNEDRDRNRLSSGGVLTGIDWGWTKEGGRGFG